MKTHDHDDTTCPHLLEAATLSAQLVEALAVFDDVKQFLHGVAQDAPEDVGAEADALIKRIEAL
jgi:hypothetical protein